MGVSTREAIPNEAGVRFLSGREKHGSLALFAGARNAALASHDSLIGKVRLCHHDFIERIILIRPHGKARRPGFALLLQQCVLQADDQSQQSLPVIRSIIDIATKLADLFVKARVSFGHIFTPSAGINEAAGRAASIHMITLSMRGLPRKLKMEIGAIENISADIGCFETT